MIRYREILIFRHRTEEGEAEQISRNRNYLTDISYNARRIFCNNKLICSGAQTRREEKN